MDLVHSVIGSTYKVDANNQLSLTPAVSFHFGSHVALVRGDRAGRLRRRGRVAGWVAISRRRRRATHHGGWVPSDRRSAGVDGRRTTDHLRGRGASRALVGEGAGATDGTGRAGRIVLRSVAGWSWTRTWMIHWETLLRKVGGNRRGTRARRKQRRYLRGSQRRGLGLGYVWAGSPVLPVLLWRAARFSLTEAWKAFEAGVRRTHKGKVGEI